MEEKEEKAQETQKKLAKLSKKDRNTLIIVSTIVVLTLTAFSLSLAFGFSNNNNETYYDWYNAKAGLYDSEGKYIDGSASSFTFGDSENGKSLISITNSFENASKAYLPSVVSLNGTQKKLDTIGNGETSILQGEYGLKEIYVNRSVNKVLSFSFANATTLTTYSHGFEKDAPLEFGDKVFYSDENLVDVFLPKNTATIGKSIFEGCISLEELDLSNTYINTIPESAFASTTSLKNLSLSKSVYSIGKSAFYKSGIETFEANSDLETIGENAFEGSSLKEINLAASKLIVLNAKVFKDTAQLNKLTISSKIKRINNNAFASSSLTSIDFEGTSEMWDAIEKDDEWNKDSSLTSIVCSDKTIDLNN